MAVVLPGCAGAPLKPAVEPLALESQTPAECTGPAPSHHAAVRLARAIGYGTVGVFLGALQGAGDGASWAWSTGSSRSDAAWIGAAAGAGLGFVIGFVAGLAKAGPGWSPEPATPLPCPPALAETTASTEDYLETASTK